MNKILLEKKNITLIIADFTITKYGQMKKTWDTSPSVWLTATKFDLSSAGKRVATIMHDKNLCL